jgi:hypothetical protein
MRAVRSLKTLVVDYFKWLRIFCGAKTAALKTKWLSKLKRPQQAHPWKQEMQPGDEDLSKLLNVKIAPIDDFELQFTSKVF